MIFKNKILFKLNRAHGCVVGFVQVNRLLNNLVLSRNQNRTAEETNLKVESADLSCG